MADNFMNVNSATTAASAKKTAATPNNTLGKDQFLKILITQMKNQDPTSPLQDKEFIAQMAQFTSVEQLTNMGNEMKLFRQSLGFSSGLIGKNVSYTTVDLQGNSQLKNGVVESIVVKQGEQFAKVDGKEVSLDQISQISNSTPETGA